jgi:TRAP-type C4-dicarboxylate transport system permease small subunit
VPDDSRPPVSRLQRSLAFFSLILIGLSVVAIIILLIVGGAGTKIPSSQLQYFVQFFPLLALPLGALGIIALFVVGMVERRRYNRDDTPSRRQSK